MNISGNIVGTRINIFIKGTLHSKDFYDQELADQAFMKMLEAKADPTDEKIDALYDLLNENIRISKAGGFEYDPETNESYLKGFKTPVPVTLFETVQEYIEKGYPVESITNFWKLLMANPDKRVRNDLFDFISNHDFVLTDKGYMIVYKAVHYMTKTDDDLATFVSNSYLKVRKDWKTGAHKYVVYKQINDDDTYELKLTKKTTFEGWDISEKNIEVVGVLDQLQAKLDELIDGDKNSTIFTDMHSKTMKIRLGSPVKMDRTECDGDPKNECSYGLHVGATKYVNNFANSDSAILVCLVNPMHVVAVPEYDASKMRVSQYYPFAVADYNDRKIDIIEQPFFEYDYIAHEEEELKALLAANEDGRTSSLNSDSDNRSYDEYVSILEARVIDISK